MAGGVWQCFPTCLFTGPFWLRKITTNLRILALVSIVLPDDRYKKLQIYISELILDIDTHK
jgi:hypothetical protein